MPGRSAAEVVHEYYDARKRGDEEVMLELVDPDAEFDLSESESPYKGIYRGHAEIQRLWAAMSDSWSANWLDIEQELVAGDRVVIGVRHQTRGRSSGIEAAASGAQVITVRGGTIVALKLFQTFGEARAAVRVGGATRTD